MPLHSEQIGWQATQLRFALPCMREAPAVTAARSHVQKRVPSPQHQTVHPVDPQLWAVDPQLSVPVCTPATLTM